MLGPGRPAARLVCRISFHFLFNLKIPCSICCRAAVSPATLPTTKNAFPILLPPCLLIVCGAVPIPASRRAVLRDFLQHGGQGWQGTPGSAPHHPSPGLALSLCHFGSLCYNLFEVGRPGRWNNRLPSFLCAARGIYNNRKLSLSSLPRRWGGAGRRRGWTHNAAGPPRAQAAAAAGTAHCRSDVSTNKIAAVTATSTEARRDPTPPRW